jgi:hypothetical protein
MLAEYLAPARDSVPPAEWDAGLAAGRALSQAEALTLLLSTSQAHDMPG